MVISVFSSLDKLHSWALSLEGCADCNIMVSHIARFYVAFRLHCRDMKLVNPYLPQTLAEDLQGFQCLFKSWSVSLGFDYIYIYPGSC